MSDAKNRTPNDRNARLRDALRENLKRRKLQLRGRSSAAGAEPDDGEPAGPAMVPSAGRPQHED